MTCYLLWTTKEIKGQTCLFNTITLLSLGSHSHLLASCRLCCDLHWACPAGSTARATRETLWTAEPQVTTGKPTVHSRQGLRSVCTHCSAHPRTLTSPLLNPSRVTQRCSRWSSQKQLLSPMAFNAWQCPLAHASPVSGRSTKTSTGLCSGTNRKNKCLLDTGTTLHTLPREIPTPHCLTGLGSEQSFLFLPWGGGENGPLESVAAFPTQLHMHYGTVPLPQLWRTSQRELQLRRYWQLRRSAWRVAIDTGCHIRVNDLYPESTLLVGFPLFSPFHSL